MQVWQSQSEKQHTSHPKHTHEVQPPHVGESKHPLHALRLARSSASSHENLRKQQVKHVTKDEHSDYLRN